MADGSRSFNFPLRQPSRVSPDGVAIHLLLGEVQNEGLGLAARYAGRTADKLKLFHSIRALRFNRSQIANDQGQRGQDDTVTAPQLIVRLRPISVFVTALNKFKKANRPCQATAGRSTQKVQTLLDISNRGERDLVQAAEHPVTEVFVLNKDLNSIRLIEQTNQMSEQTCVGRNLGNDVHKNKQTLCFITIRLLVRLATGNFDGNVARPVCGLTQAVSKDAEYTRGDYSGDGAGCRPGIPVHHTRFAQPPALAHAIEHRHSNPSLLEPILP